MVANAFEVGEQLRVKDTGLIRTGPGLHPLQLILAEQVGHVIDALLQSRDVRQPEQAYEEVFYETFNESSGFFRRGT